MLPDHVPEANLATEKAEWRKRLSAQRKRYNSDCARRSAEAVASQITALPEWQSANIIASYMAYSGELDLLAADNRARDAGKTVVYPRIVGAGLLEFRHWQPDDAIDHTAYGLAQPTADAMIMATGDIDLFLVPLLGCDQRGIRLGYGGGYYDRALCQATGFLCGVGYAWQYVDTLPGEVHDQRLNAFISDSSIVRFEGAA